MANWFSGVLNAVRHEIDETFRTPWLLVTGVLMPLVWLVILVLMFGSGFMRSLPVGLVDLDKTAQSRETVQTLAALPSVSFESYDSAAQARDALAGGHIYALTVIPEHWSQKSRAQEGGAAIELYFNKTYYAAATTLELDMKTALADLSSRQAIAKAASAGGGFKGGELRVKTIGADVFFEGNPAFNYRTYLLATLMPGVLGLAAILTFVGVVTREWRQRRLECWFDSSIEPGARLVGKLTPWVTLYALYGLAYVAWFAGFQGTGAAGSVIVWCAGMLLLMLSMAGFALFFCALLPSWITALSLSICFTAPIYPFTGFSYPLESMGWGAQLLGHCFPLTWFLKLQASQWVLDSPWHYVAELLSVQALFVLVPAFAGGYVFIKLLPSRLAAQQRRRPAADNDSVDGFFAVAWTTIKKGLFNKDTFIIFAGAVAFYLIFYAWPYGNQTITNIPTAVVDLDRTATSREVVRRLAAAPTVRIVAQDADAAQARELYATARVDGVITIRENFEADMLAGKAVGVSFVANGAFPVKARAVQSTLLTVVRELTTESLARNLMRAGAAAGDVKRLELQPTSVADQNMFNWVNGYATYVVPLVSVIILQASLFMAIIMSIGQWLSEKTPNGVIRTFLGSAKGFFGVAFGLWAYGAFWFAYAQGWDFALFDFTSMKNPVATLVVAALAISSMVALCLMIILWLNSNAYGAQLLVMISAPAVFLSGGVYPTIGFEWPAQVVAFFIPSSPAMIGMVNASQSGASIAALQPYIVHLALQTIVYTAIAYAIAVRRAKERGLRAVK